MSEQTITQSECSDVSEAEAETCSTKEGRSLEVHP